MFHTVVVKMSSCLIPLLMGHMEVWQDTKINKSFMHSFIKGKFGFNSKTLDPIFSSAFI